MKANVIGEILNSCGEPITRVDCFPTACTYLLVMRHGCTCTALFAGVRLAHCLLWVIGWQAWPKHQHAFMAFQWVTIGVKEPTTCGLMPYPFTPEPFGITHYQRTGEWLAGS
jgi:hypothetical protein